jgi:trimeric autotransporter adhesin
LMQQLDAGIQQSTERERAVQAGRRRESHVDAEPKPVSTPDPAPVSAAAPAPAPAPVATPVESGVIEPNSAPAAEPVESDPATVEALRLIADQRKAAEALLLETRALEDQIKNAAAAAQATRAYQAAKKAADSALVKLSAAEEAETQAAQRAEGLLHDHSVLANELRNIERLVAAKRTEADSAKAQIADLQRQIGELERASQSVFADLALHESRVRECSARENAAARAAAETAARAAARKGEREAAEAAAQSAQERAEALKAQLPAAEETGAIEDLQRLTARITEQVQVARSLRNGSLNGKKAS